MGGTCSIFSARCIEGFREKNPFGISRGRWEDNIKMDFQEVWENGLHCSVSG